jgi:hypothetical protein
MGLKRGLEGGIEHVACMRVSTCVGVIEGVGKRGPSKNLNGGWGGGGEGALDKCKMGVSVLRSISGFERGLGAGGGGVNRTCCVCERTRARVCVKE